MNSIINTRDAYDADIVLLGANYERTSSFLKGQRGGPREIVSCLNNQIEFFERISGIVSCGNLKIAYHDIGDLNEFDPKEMVEEVQKIYDEYLGLDKFVVILGGEHSVSCGAFRSISKQSDSSKITVVQIDAHFDLRNDDSDYNDKPHGKYAHSCVMRRAYELGFKIIPIGIRAYSEDELNFAKDNKIKFFEWGIDDCHPSIDDIMRSIITDKVYITLDVDGIDPSHMPATGTPVQGGLSWYYVNHLLLEIFKRKQVIGVDIVEVAPCLTNKLTEYGAAQLCYNMIVWKNIKNLE
jgi:agmatinase